MKKLIIILCLVIGPFRWVWESYQFDGIVSQNYINMRYAGKICLNMADSTFQINRNVYKYYSATQLDAFNISFICKNINVQLCWQSDKHSILILNLNNKQHYYYLNSPVVNLK